MGFRKLTWAKPYGDRAEIVQKSCNHRAFSAASVLWPRGLCDRHVVLGIRVQKYKLYNSACVVGLDGTKTDQNKRWEGKEVQEGKC